MGIRLGSISIIVALLHSCTFPEEPSIAEDSIELASWTQCFNQSGFEELKLSDHTDRQEGRAHEVRSMKYDNQLELNAHLETFVEEGYLRELRLRLTENSKISLDSLYTDVRERFKELFGKAMPTTGYSSWKAATNSGTLMEIEMMDARTLFQKEEIIIHWKEHTDKLYED